MSLFNVTMNNFKPKPRKIEKIDSYWIDMYGSERVYTDAERVIRDKINEIIDRLEEKENRS